MCFSTIQTINDPVMESTDKLQELMDDLGVSEDTALAVMEVLGEVAE